MGYFFRKSARIGTFRLNFSKSGIGASFGVKGARLTMTPRGTTYVTVGSHGFYYRESLSNRNRSQAYPGTPSTVSLGTPRQSDEIVTAGVSDLVDSSSGALVEQLNKRAQTFNPAWLLYAAALLVGVIAVIAFASVPDVADSESMPNSTAGSVTDDYSLFVIRYGYPTSVLESKPLGLLPVRRAQYRRANIQAVFTPNACMSVYADTMRILADAPSHPASAKREAKKLRPCSASAETVWKIVSFIDSADNSTVSVESAKERLGGMGAKLSTPPVLEVVNDSAGKRKGSPSTSGKQSTKAQTVPLPKTWTMQEQVRQTAEAVEKRRRLPTLTWDSFAWTRSGTCPSTINPPTCSTR